MISEIFGMDGIVLLIIAVAVLFGSSQLPKLAKNISSASREFRKAHRDADGEVDVAAHAISVETIVPQLGETATTTNMRENRQ